jgi:hypothetical protein
MPPLDDAERRAFNGGILREARRALRAGVELDALKARLVELAEQAARDVAGERWRAALAAVVTIEDAPLAERIRMAVHRAEKARADLAVLKVQAPRAARLVALIDAAGFEVVEAGERRAHNTRGAPDLRLVSFRITTSPVGAKLEAEDE